MVEQSQLLNRVAEQPAVSRAEWLKRRAFKIGALALSSVALVGVSAKASGGAYQAERGMAIERSYVDNQDITTLPRVGFIYAVPKGNVDHGYDTDGTVETLIRNSQDWVAGPRRLEGGSLRIDTRLNGYTDVVFNELELTEAEILSERGNAIHRFRAELNKEGFSTNPDKVWLILLDGKMAYPDGSITCGYAYRPPLGNHGTGAVSLNCTDAKNASYNKFSTLDLMIQHEGYHGAGIVQDGAPQADGIHSTEPYDLMRGDYFDARDSGKNIVVDPGHDNYYPYLEKWLDYTNKDLSITVNGKGYVRSNPSPNKYWAGKGVTVESPSRPGEEPRDIYCLDDCEMLFRPNLTTTLIAEPEDKTWKFRGWGGNGTGSKERTLTMKGDQNVTVNFEKVVNFDVNVKGFGEVRVLGRSACKQVIRKASAKAQTPIKRCFYEFRDGEKVELRANGANFIKWFGIKACSTKVICRTTAHHGHDEIATALFKSFPTKRKSKSR